MSDLLVFSCNADPILIASGARLGITVHSYSPTPWKGFVDGKLRHGIDFLTSRTEPVAMFLDGADTLLLKPESDILSRWGDRVLISAERTCWPDASLASHFPDIQGPHFPNSGGYIGPREDLILAMRIAVEWATNEDDQLAWIRAMVDGALPWVRIDHERRVFCSQGDGGDVSVADPCSTHFNGRTKGRNELWKLLC